MKNIFFIAFFLLAGPETYAQAIDWPVNKTDKGAVRFFTPKVWCPPDTFYVAAFTMTDLISKRIEDEESTVSATLYPEYPPDVPMLNVLSITFETMLGGRNALVEVSAYTYRFDLGLTNGCIILAPEDIHITSVLLITNLASECEYRYVVGHFHQGPCSQKVCEYSIDQILGHVPQAYAELESFVSSFMRTHQARIAATNENEMEDVQN